MPMGPYRFLQKGFYYWLSKTIGARHALSQQSSVGCSLFFIHRSASFQVAIRIQIPLEVRSSSSFLSNPSDRSFSWGNKNFKPEKNPTFVLKKAAFFGLNLVLICWERPSFDFSLLCREGIFLICLFQTSHSKIRHPLLVIWIFAWAIKNTLSWELLWYSAAPIGNNRRIKNSVERTIYSGSLKYSRTGLIKPSIWTNDQCRF